MRLGNAEVARTLGMSHSSVSRMRTGERVASPTTLQQLVTEYSGDPEVLVRAAAKAAAGDTAEWVEYLDEILRDDVEDPEEIGVSG